MKIYQVIAEDYDNTSLFKEPTSNSTEKENPKSDDQNKETDSDSPVQKAVSNVKSFMPDIGIDLTTLALVGISAIAITKMSNAALSSSTSNFAKKLRLSQKVEAMWKKRYGPWGKFFGVLGLASAITQLYENLYVLEAMYVQGKLPGDDGGYSKFVEQREFEFGIFTTQLLMPTLLKWLVRAVSTLSGVKLAVRLLGGLSVSATLGASIAATIASEAFIRWLQWWLGSDQGRNVIYNWAGGFVRTIGKPADSLWDLIMNQYQALSGKTPSVPGSYDQADVKKYGSQEKAAAAKADREEKTKAAGKDTGMLGTSSKTGYITDPKNPETKIAVTDPQGNLLGNAALMANPQVNLLRTQAKMAGQPDPLAQFAKPGQRLPAIP